jgi:hypothetical protein
MANVVTKGRIESILPYLGEGAQAVLEGLWRFMPPDVKFSDSLSLYVADAVHTIVEISDTAARPHVLIAESNGTACTVKLYGDDSGDVTVGTTDAIASVGVSGTSGDLSCLLITGAGVKTLASASSADGLSIAAPATDVGTGAVANDPTVWVVYSNA